MIYSEKQCHISSGKRTKLKSALAVTEAQPKEEEWRQEIKIEGLKSQIAEMEADIANYDMLKAGEIIFAKSCSLDALPNVLIEAKIASGMSQTYLADASNVQSQQIQRDEAI